MRGAEGGRQPAAAKPHWYITYQVHLSNNNDNPYPYDLSCHNPQLATVAPDRNDITGSKRRAGPGSLALGSVPGGLVDKILGARVE